MSTHYARLEPAARTARAWLILSPDAAPPAVVPPGFALRVLPDAVVSATPSAIARATAGALRALLDANPGRRPRALLVAAAGGILTPDCLPGPTLRNVPVSLIPRDCVDACLHAQRHVTTVSRSGRVSCAVLSMWNQRYLEWGARLTESAQHGAATAGARGAAVPHVEGWPATEVLRPELCRRLADGPALVIYVGHGRERGWSGYRGVRWRHVDAAPAVRPITALLAFTCRNLCAPVDGELSFGEQWVVSGRAHAFFGATSAVQLRSLELIGRTLEAILARGPARDLASIIAQLDRSLRRTRDAAALTAWRTFRIVGNPLLPLES